MNKVNWSFRWWCKLILPLASAYFFIGLRFFYPYHVFFANIFLLAFFIVLVIRLRDLFWPHLLRYKFLAVLALVAGGFMWIVFTLLPVGSPFVGLSSQEVGEMLNEDRSRALRIVDRLEVSSVELFELIEGVDDFDPTNQEGIKVAWMRFLRAFIEAETLSQKYRFFYSLRNEAQREEAFVIAYSLYMTKYRYVYDLIDLVEMESVRAVLNENVDFLYREKIFSDLTSHFFSSDNFLKMNVGRAYLASTQLDGDVYYRLLRSNAVGHYDYLLENLDGLIANVPSAFDDFVEKNFFAVWLPVQKEVSMALDVRVVNREYGLITEAQINEMRKFMEPGDIMLARRNWYLTNVGIPGFWPHALIYLDDFENQNAYFAEVFPYKGYENFETFFAGEFPALYEKVKMENLSVIESVSEGVIFSTLEHAADADFIAVLRPNVGKLAKLQSLERAYRNYGKPYDFNFDIYTTDALFCSELIFDAYLPLEGKEGIIFDTQYFSGRRSFPAVMILERFAQERVKQEPALFFVYFLRSDENSEKAYVGTEAELLDSLKWSKYEFLQ